MIKDPIAEGQSLPVWTIAQELPLELSLDLFLRENDEGKNYVRMERNPTDAGYKVLRHHETGMSSVLLLSQKDKDSEGTRLFFAKMPPQSDYNYSGYKEHDDRDMEVYLEARVTDLASRLVPGKVPEVHDIVMTEYGMMAVYEYIPGPNLYERVMKKPPEISITIFHEVLDDIFQTYIRLKQHGINHMDLKCSNILLRKSLEDDNSIIEPVLCDFGTVPIVKGPDFEESSFEDEIGVVLSTLARHETSLSTEEGDNTIFNTAFNRHLKKPYTSYEELYRELYPN